jgi:hypothetical protein
VRNSLLVVFCSVCITACKNDDNPLSSDSSKISGNWSLTKITVGGVDLPLVLTTKISFSNDNTFECNEYSKSGRWASYYGKWSFSDGKITLVYHKEHGNKCNEIEIYSYNHIDGKLILTGTNIIASYNLPVYLLDPQSKTIQEYSK